MTYAFARPHLAAEIDEIRAYTKAHDELRACHHFCFDFRLGAFERAQYVVMGVNPGETRDDLAVAPGPQEESSLHDYRAGVDSRSRQRWFDTCIKVVGSDQIALSELFFWSSPNVPALVERIGPLKSSPHGDFCRRLNERLIAFHQPKAIVLPGLGLLPLATSLYGLWHVGQTSSARGRRLIEHYERDGVPWIFTPHWSGSFGFSCEDRAQIADYLTRL